MENTTEIKLTIITEILVTLNAWNMDFTSVGLSNKGKLSTDIATFYKELLLDGQESFEERVRLSVGELVDLNSERWAAIAENLGSWLSITQGDLDEALSADLLAEVGNVKKTVEGPVVCSTDGELIAINGKAYAPRKDIMVITLSSYYHEFNEEGTIIKNSPFFIFVDVVGENNNITFH